MCCGYPFEGYLDEGVSNGISGGSAISPEGWRYNICLDEDRCIVDPQDGVSPYYMVMMQVSQLPHSAVSLVLSLHVALGKIGIARWCQDTIIRWLSSESAKCWSGLMMGVDRTLPQQGIHVWLAATCSYLSIIIHCELPCRFSFLLMLALLSRGLGCKASTEEPPTAAFVHLSLPYECCCLHSPVWLIQKSDVWKFSLSKICHPDAL